MGQGHMAVDRFHWTTFDVNSLLPDDWQASVMNAVDVATTTKILLTKHSTSREGGKALALPTAGVGGIEVETRLPWLRQLYETTFRDLAQLTSDEPVSIMSDRKFGVVFNVQSGADRYECHVDTNPIEGLLYFTSHPEGQGGELVVSNLGDVGSIQEVDQDATFLHPQAGHLVFFDGRHHTHYVRRLVSDDDIRIVAAMNFYVPSCPEEMRPNDLNLHLSGKLEAVGVDNE
jgi:hypothetical protein